MQLVNSQRNRYKPSVSVGAECEPWRLFPVLELMLFEFEKLWRAYVSTCEGILGVVVRSWRILIVVNPSTGITQPSKYTS